MSVEKVLVVDDSRTDLQNLALICSGAGYIVVTASCGTEAIERVKSEHPDAVLLDIVMDDLNGFQVCRAIHNDPSTRHVAVVLVSSKSEATSRVWGQRQGARGYIAKPYTAQQILDELRTL